MLSPAFKGVAGSNGLTTWTALGAPSIKAPRRVDRGIRMSLIRWLSARNAAEARRHGADDPEEMVGDDVP